MAYFQIAAGLTLTIPTDGTRNWGSTLKNTTWQKISAHDHSGAGNGAMLSAASYTDFSFTRDKFAKGIGLFPFATTLLPIGTTETIDFAVGSIQKLDLHGATGDVTLTISNAIAGITYKVIIIQGATARDIIWPASVKWPQGEKPILSLLENAIDKIELYFDGAVFLADWNLDYK